MATVPGFSTTSFGSIPIGSNTPMESAALVVVYGEHPGRQVHLGAKPITIGRGNDCDVRIRDSTASRRHCICWAEDGKYHVRDLDSTNATLVNGCVTSEAQLVAGDYLIVGSTIFRLVRTETLDGRFRHDLDPLGRIDVLTRLPNHRHFRELLDTAVPDARSTRFPLCLALVDLDHFTRVNDAFGHAAGDDLLRVVGNIVCDHVFEYESASRIDGEEFALLLRRTPLHVARNRMQRLRRDIAEHRTVIEGTHIAITASIGIAEWNTQHDSAVQLMREADAQLQRAKMLGRNRVCTPLEETA
jgi:two-component system, cell cycle response regulator